MDTQKILEQVRCQRSAIAAMDRELASIQAELEKDQLPPAARKRRNLKAGRVADIERFYAKRVIK